MDKYILCILVFIFNIVLTATVESRLIPFLSKKAKQPIYEVGPSWHLKKSGTPTMGGIAFLVSISISILIISINLILRNINRSDGISMLITLLFAVGNSMIGIFDDLMKLHKRENAGLSPLQKIGLQTIISIIFLMSRHHYLGDGTAIQLWFGKIELGVFYYPIALILLLGIVNCANLTDGIDGLASSIAVTIGLIFLLIGYSISLEVPIISSALVGSSCGFLFFNINPAKIFMGDTGSLFLGSLAVGLAFSLKNPLLVLPIGIVYVIEGISVILQVAIFKLTKKRLFKMAPIHHHLEKSGMNENRICVVGVIVTLVVSVISILLMRI